MDYVKAIKKLCNEADIILPNVTEACFLLDIPFADDAQCSAETAEKARKLLGKKLKNVLITSCRFEDDKTGLICVGEDPFTHMHEKRLPSCHGSGDLFASVFSGLMLKRPDVEKAARTAADFTFDCLLHSAECEDHRWYGVDYEAMLPELAHRAEEYGA